MDGFKVIYWKFLTGAVKENVEPCAGTHLKVICQNVAYLWRKLPVILDVRLTMHTRGFDQELGCTRGLKHTHPVDG